MIQAFLILTTLFLQEQAILPNTLGGTQNSSAEIERLASLVQSGWGVDPVTRKFVFTIQIPPESLTAFTAGRFGNDLGAPIPPDIRPFVEEVIIRIGTGPLPRTAPTPEMRASLSRNSQPMVATLDDRRTLTDIDPVLPAAGQGGLNNGLGSSSSNNGNILPPGMSPSGNSNSGSLLPNNSALNNPGSSSFGGADGSALPGSTTGGFNDAPSLLGGSGARQPNPLPTVGGNGAMPSTNPSNLGTSATPGRTDGFRSDSNTNSMLGRLTGGTPPIPATNPTTGAGSLSTPYATSNPAMPRVANNPLPNNTSTNPPGAGYGAPNGYNPVVAPGVNPGAGQGFNPGLQPAPQYDPRIAAGYNPPISNPPSAAQPQGPLMQNPTGAPVSGTSLPPAGSVNPTGVLSPADTQPGVTIDKLLPLITLMLLVINIYQFFWMAHVRTRYKEMVISKRTAQLNLSNT